MPKLPSSEQVESILTTAGFFFKRQKGSHKRYWHADGRKVTITANKKYIPIGTLKSISRQSQIPLAVFLG